MDFLELRKTAAKLGGEGELCDMSLSKSKRSDILDEGILFAVALTLGLEALYREHRDLRTQANHQHESVGCDQDPNGLLRAAPRIVH